MRTVMLRYGVLAAFLLVLISCSSSGTGPGPASASGRGGNGRGAGAPVPVVTARAERKAVPVTIPAVGTVEAMATVEIRAEVTGQLKGIHFAEGSEVQQGQPLFTLDARPFQAALQQAQAVLARDTATLQNAQSVQQRAETLFQRGLIPREQFESQRAGAAALAATVEADKAAIETARLNLQHTEIASPITGRTGSLGVHVGDLARANDTTPMVVINQLAPVYVMFAVPGRFLGDIRRFQASKPLAVTATAPASNVGVASPANAGAAPEADGGESGAGTARAGGARGAVTFIDNAVDVATGTIRLKATFPNSDRQLWPGAFVQVTLGLTVEPDAVVVPVTAVQSSQDAQFVFVVKPDRTVEMRTVRVERQHAGEAVIAEGISPGDEVVTDGQLRLTPGARVSERGDGTGRSAPPAGGRG